MPTEKEETLCDLIWMLSKFVLTVFVIAVLIAQYQCSKRKEAYREMIETTKPCKNHGGIEKKIVVGGKGTINAHLFGCKNGLVIWR